MQNNDMLIDSQFQMTHNYKKETEQNKQFSSLT